MYAKCTPKPLWPFIPFDWDRHHFVHKDPLLELTAQENNALPIESLIVISSTIDVCLGVCGAWSCDSPYQAPQEDHATQVGEVISLIRDLNGVNH